MALLPSEESRADSVGEVMRDDTWSKLIKGAHEVEGSIWRRDRAYRWTATAPSASASSPLRSEETSRQVSIEP